MFCRVVAGAVLAPKLAPWSVDMSDKGRLAGGMGLVLVRRTKTVAEINQQHVRAEGRTLLILLVA